MCYEENYEKFFSKEKCCVDEFLGSSSPLVRDDVEGLVVVIVVDHGNKLGVY
jgi:hypothetical protein